MRCYAAKRFHKGMEVLLKSTTLFLPMCMYSVLLFKYRFPQKNKSSLIFGKGTSGRSTRVVYDTTTKVSRDFDKLEDLVHLLLISLKVLERDVLTDSQGKLQIFHGN